jgi:hypothetical protein
MVRYFSGNTVNSNYIFEVCYVLQVYLFCTEYLVCFSAAGSVATPMVWSGSMASCAAGSASAATPRTLASSRYNHLIMLPSCAVIHQVSRLPVYCRELCIICCSGDLWIKSILILRPLHVYTHHIVFIRHMLLSILLWKHQLALVSEFIVQKLLSAASLTHLSFFSLQYRWKLWFWCCDGDPYMCQKNGCFVEGLIYML